MDNDSLMGRDLQVWNALDNATKWCVHYCITHNVDNTVLWRVANLAMEEPSVSYTLIKNTENNKFSEMAKKLRELWPEGMRTIDGKEYPWRDSVANLRRRLQALWKLRKLDKYTEDDVLQCARRYLSRFEDDKKFMKSLKYFILKTETNSKFKQSQSILADMLENVDVEANQAEWDTILQNGNYGEGELV